MMGGTSYKVKIAVAVTGGSSGLVGITKCVSVTVFAPPPKIRAISETQLVAKPARRVRLVARTNLNAS